MCALLCLEACKPAVACYSLPESDGQAGGPLHCRVDTLAIIVTGGHECGCSRQRIGGAGGDAGVLVGGGWTEMGGTEMVGRAGEREWRGG